MKYEDFKVGVTYLLSGKEKEKVASKIDTLKWILTTSQNNGLSVWDKEGQKLFIPGTRVENNNDPFTILTREVHYDNVGINDGFHYIYNDGEWAKPILPEFKVTTCVESPQNNNMETSLTINTIDSLTRLFSALKNVGKTKESSKVLEKILELVNKL